MGELRDDHDKRLNNMYTERLRLRAQKKTDPDVDKILKEAHDKELKGKICVSINRCVYLETKLVNKLLE